LEVASERPQAVRRKVGGSFQFPLVLGGQFRRCGMLVGERRIDRCSRVASDERDEGFEDGVAQLQEDARVLIRVRSRSLWLAIQAREWECATEPKIMAGGSRARSQPQRRHLMRRGLWVSPPRSQRLAVLHDANHDIRNLMVRGLPCRSPSIIVVRTRALGRDPTKVVR
jgi:hypothetical protein